MLIDTDFHSHISYTSAMQMARAAQEKGLRVLGLSEHVFQMREVRPVLEHMPKEGQMLDFPTYIAEVHEAAQQVNVELRIGLEVDFIPDKQEDIQARLQIQGYAWDFLIGSVHEVDGLQFEHKEKWSREEGEARWLRYFELLRQAVSSGYFNLISHPVRMRVMNAHLPPTFDEELEHLAAEAARCDVALELNGYDMRKYPELVQRLARACALHHTRVSVGSDAHRPGEIAQAHQQSAELLGQVGITHVRTWRKQKIEEYSIANGER